jgi:hypothetical protein
MSGRPSPDHRARERQDDGGAPRRVRAADILRPAFKRFMWHAYDHLGLLVLANLLWVTLCLPVITAPAATAGLFLLARRIANGEPASIADMLTGFREQFLPALKVGFATLVVVLLLWINVDFYSHLGGWATLPGMLLAAVMIWGAAFVLLMHVHLHPLIADGDTGLPTLLRKSSLLVLDNIGYSVGIAVQALLVAFLCAITGAGLFLALGSFVALLLSCGHRELLKRYFPDSEEASEPEETRGWRDFWRPWETRRRT